MSNGIYKIECLETGKCYIGQSKNIERRWKAHHKKYPVDKFSYQILVRIDLKDLDLLERLFIDVYDSHKNGFNKTIGGAGIKVRYPDDETRAKMCEAQKGRKHSDESKVKMSEAKKGKKFSDESKAKMSEAGRNRKPISDETRAKISEAGRNISDETRAKMCEAQKNRRNK